MTWSSITDNTDFHRYFHRADTSDWWGEEVGMVKVVKVLPTISSGSTSGYPAMGRGGLGTTPSPPSPASGKEFSHNPLSLMEVAVKTVTAVIDVYNEVAA